MPFYVGDALLAHAQAGCYRCTRGSDLIDLDVQIVGEGALVLCKGCITEAAEAAGLTYNGAHVRALEAELALERRAREEAQALESALQDALSRLRQPSKPQPKTQKARNRA